MSYLHQGLVRAGVIPANLKLDVPAFRRIKNKNLTWHQKAIENLNFIFLLKARGIITETHPIGKKNF